MISQRRVQCSSNEKGLKHSTVNSKDPLISELQPFLAKDLWNGKLKINKRHLTSIALSSSSLISLKNSSTLKLATGIKVSSIFNHIQSNSIAILFIQRVAIFHCPLPSGNADWNPLITNADSKKFLLQRQIKSFFIVCTLRNFHHPFLPRRFPLFLWADFHLNHNKECLWLDAKKYSKDKHKVCNFKLNLIYLLLKVWDKLKENVRDF